MAPDIAAQRRFSFGARPLTLKISVTVIGRGGFSMTYQQKLNFLAAIAAFGFVGAVIVGMI